MHLYAPEPIDGHKPIVCQDCGHWHDPIRSLCPITCPACGYIGDIETFDVLGADDGNLFCTTCGLEFPA